MKNKRLYYYMIVNRKRRFLPLTDEYEFCNLIEQIISVQNSELSLLS